MKALSSDAASDKGMSFFNFLNFYENGGLLSCKI